MKQPFINGCLGFQEFPIMFPTFNPLEVCRLPRQSWVHRPFKMRVEKNGRVEMSRLFDPLISHDLQAPYGDIW